MNTPVDRPELDADLIQAVEKLIDAGCHYRLQALAECYTPDLEIVMVQADGRMAVFDYAQNMAFFRQRLESGAAPLNTSVRFLYAQQRQGTGYVIAMRHMNLGAGEQTLVFSLMLRQVQGQWRVFREHAVAQGAASV